MKKFIFTILLMLMPVMHAMANYYYTYVDGLYYDLKSDGTASVTSKFRYTDGSNEYSTNDYSGDVVIPSTVTYNNITYKVTRIHDWAFWGCKGLKSVTIPGSIKYIGSEAFYFCSNYIINIEDIAAWCNIEMDDNSCLLYKNLYHNGEEIRDLVIPDNVTVIGKDAFRGCGSLTSVTIPNSVKSIKQYAFQGCKNLTSINIPTSMSLILAYTFAGCSSLKNVTIPDNISVIFAYAFSGCTSLTSITIPNSVTGMGGFAFEQCSSLQSVTLSNNMTSIDEYEFWNCTSLTSISIPNSITSIKYGAFSGCSGLSSITIPKSVTSIGKYAFQNCTGLTTIKSEIEDPFEIDTNVFSSSDTDIYATATLIVPKGKKSAYNSTEGWKNFKYIVEEGEFVVDGIYYKVDENNTASVIKGNRTYSGDIVIPAYVNYDGKTYNVTSIDEYAFQSCSGLTSVTIPNSVTSIGDFAFIGCSGLTSLLIPSNVTSIGSWTFYNCRGLTSVTIPNSVTSIGDLAFWDCSGLTSVTIPNSVTYIGNSVFRNCSGLASVKVESGNIKYDSRNDCNAIIEKSSQTLIAGCKNTIIPNGVTTIGEHAFSGCDGLTSVTIPNSVTSIGKGAFYGCNGLKTIVSKLGSPVNIIYRVVYKDGTAINEYSFSGETFANAVLYVTKGTKSLYEATEGWKKFTNIEEFVDGDVNLDEKVNRKDQNVLVAHIMGEKPEGFFDGLADLNGDDDVNAADVVTLVNILNNGGLSTEAEFGYDNVDGSLVVSSLTCTLNNERDEAILLTKCELYSNGSLLRSKSFSNNPVSVAASGNKSCTFDNLTKPANSTDFTVCWHYTVNDESFVYRCPLTD